MITSSVNPLRTEVGFEVLTNLRPALLSYIAAIDEQIGSVDHALLDSAFEAVAAAKAAHRDYDEVLNDLFVLDRIIYLIRSYANIWSQISRGDFSGSWVSLQDSNDQLRLIRRFSNFTFERLAIKLSNLEGLYPYRLFASCGYVVERFTCSICGEDVESLECEHREGVLYAGELARRVGSGLEIDHISLVKNPADKRCVIQVDEDAPGFSALGFLSESLLGRKFRVSDIEAVEWSKRKRVGHVDQGRNDMCQCGSTRKYKKCCLDKNSSPIDHAEIIVVRRNLGRLWYPLSGRCAASASRK